MARRLLSGWLIALAALARSLALMFERAAADRSEPVPDPVMAELGERYPGAPAHWLAHVAEGMARSAEAGGVPLSLTSDTMAWPPLRPTMAPASHDGAAPDPEITNQPASDPPPRSIPPPPSRRAVEAVPSLEALQSRSSEVWRRPAGASRRPSRPVFAPPADPVLPRVASEGAAPIATPHQPRPRPTVAVRTPSQARPDVPEPPAPAAETVRGEAAPLAARPTSEIRPTVRSAPEAGSETVEASPKAHAAPPLQSVATTPAIATAFEPPVGKAPRSMIQPEAERLVAVDAAHVERLRPSLARRVRRAVFRALAALRAKPRADRDQASTRPRLRLVSETPAREDARQPVNPPLRAVFPTVAEPRVALRRTAPPIRTAPHAVRRTPRLVWSQAPAQVQAARQASPPPVDDRWPAFPPKTFLPPPVAEVPSPRLEQLAREQEEGRWSV